MEINATNGLLADIFDLNSEMENETNDVSIPEEDWSIPQEEFSSLEKESDSNEECLESNFPRWEGGHTARGGADWTLPLAVPGQAQADIRQYLKNGKAEPQFK